MNGEKKTLLMVVIAACYLAFLCSGAWAWQANINGTFGSGADVANAVAVDGVGNVVAAGFTTNTGTGFDFTVIKFNGSSSAVLWSQAINGTANGADDARAVAVDGVGNVVAAGSTTNTGTSRDFTVIKFDGTSGAELWRQVINGTANGSDEARAVAVDGAGNVVAAGVTQNIGTSLDFTVIKFDGSSGAVLWSKAINGTANSADVASAVAVDGAGNVVAAGSTINTGTGGDFTVIKFDGTSGAVLWSKAINGTANAFEEALAVAVDGAGNVAAAGYTFNTGTFNDFTVVKFDGTSGAVLWSKAINGTANNFDEAFAVAVDGVGNVVAAGRTTNIGTIADFTVIKFDGTSGAELWRKVIDGTASGADFARAVAVDGVGNVVAAGFTTNTGTSRDFTVIKFDGVNGAELWRQVINGTANGFDEEASAVAVDGAGNVVAAGRINNTGTGFDFAVVKFDGSSSAVLWRQAINGQTNSTDSASAVAVDGAGNVVAAGLTDNTGTDWDFTVVKFDGVSGAELWQRDINGTANGRDRASAVAVDGAGNVVAAGFTTNTGTGRDFTVIKFDGTSGAELWRQAINGTANGSDEASAVAVDGMGNVVAAGVTSNTGTGGDFTVIKFNGSSGAVLWSQAINGTANSFDIALAVAVDGAGNVVAAGVTVNTGTERDFTVIKFDGSSGAVLWSQAINGTANGADFAFAVAVDGAGNVVAAGSTRNTSIFEDDFTVIKFDGSSGAELWRQVINGTASGSGVANAVAVDGVGNVVAAGDTTNTGTGRGFTVIKFDGSSGAELWRQVINGTASGSGVANAVAVDGVGNVVAAGRTENTGTLNDFTVIKFDGMSGAELWRRVINGTANGFDEASAVAVDGVGNVVAAGFTETFRAGTDADDDFTVVKLRGIDGGDF